MSKKILIVDDKEDMAKVLAARIKERGYAVSAVMSAREVPALVERDRPDLIILDIMMPGMSGAELAGQLRSNKETSDIPIIFLSAMLSKEEEKSCGGKIGNDTILAKPFDIEVLIKKIREKLAGS